MPEMDKKIRILEAHLIADGLYYATLAGPSDAVKPISGIVSGSIFIESDTATVLVFDETGESWNAF